MSFVQDCDISNALAMEILECSTKLLGWTSPTPPEMWGEPMSYAIIHCIMIYFLPNPTIRHPIAHQWGWDMGVSFVSSNWFDDLHEHMHFCHFCNESLVHRHIPGHQQSWYWLRMTCQGSTYFNFFIFLTYKSGRFPNRTLYLQNIPTCHWYHSYMLAVVYSNGKYTN